jgi:hypothetical protein
MSEQYELQETTVGALVAEGLEAEANRMPPSYSAQAENLLQQAARLRAQETKVIHIWREGPSKKA